MHDTSTNGSGESTDIDEAVPVLQVRSLSKSFGGVRALREVSFDLWRGEVLGLLGDNGAGKTTMVSCLSGTLSPDSGSILLDGEPVVIESAQRARALGIEVVHQDLALADNLDITANLFLGAELRVTNRLGHFMGVMDRRGMHRASEDNLKKLHINLPSVRTDVVNLSGGQRQAIAVGRAVAFGKQIVLLDEPAAALGVEQTALVLNLIKRLRDQGVAVLLISHNMHDVLEVCDRVVVLRHGVNIGEIDDLSDVTPRDLVDLITGATLTSDVRHTDEAPV